MKLQTVLWTALLALQQHGSGVAGLVGRPRNLIKDSEAQRSLQDIVTWDEHSLFIHGERVMIFSGEFHPFRLPVPTLWSDVFEKIKALGLNTVSFYTDWALLEGKEGSFEADGIFGFDQFFQAAKDAGIYLIARPGPYINAEVSGGGFPGWLQRVNAILRTNATSYMEATNNYMSHMGGIIAKAQITNGGPVILVQPENEYTSFASGFPLNPYYMQDVENQLRSAGIVVPLISNDASPDGHDVPGSGVGQVDIYGYDSYPLGFDCANPYDWPANDLPTNYHALHEQQSPTTPHSIDEFQGGSFDPPGGPGFAQCAILLNNEFERVFYKNNFAAGVAIMNIYMIFGGTNWGNLGQPGGYASYDYGAAIKEDRTIDREKYAELKLEAQFMKVSPGYLVAEPNGTFTTGMYSSNTDIAVTAVQGEDGSFFITRHSDYSSTDSATYTLEVPTSEGLVKIPQFGGSLTLNGRDSKMIVVDYPVGDSTLLYSSAEVFTWKKFSDHTVLVVYDDMGSQDELAVKINSGKGSRSQSTNKPVVLEGSDVLVKNIEEATVISWVTTADRRIVKVGDLYIYLVDRNAAYQYWVPELSATNVQQDAVIVNGGYLVRSASINKDTLELRADYNITTNVEVIGVPSGINNLEINGKQVQVKKGSNGVWTTKMQYPSVKVSIPKLATLDWYYIDSLPEISKDYDDFMWTTANLNKSYNSKYPLNGEPVSLYGADYHYDVGTLLFRGHFTATGTETDFVVATEGGQAYGASMWLGSTFLGSFVGTADAETGTSTLKLPTLKAGEPYIITIVVDNTGLDENWTVGTDSMKAPRGITNYTLSSGAPITWKLTGNLGGEDYYDHVRGPLNEGGLFIERQGYHQPEPPLSKFTSGSPFNGINEAGVAFYTAKLPLDLPGDDWDIPLSLVFTNDTAAAATGAYRSLIYINGYQFGRYTSNIGPQTEFPVPQGVWNYNGDNWISLTLWALDAGGAKVPSFDLTPGRPVLTGRNQVELIDAPVWKLRPKSY